MRGKDIKQQQWYAVMSRGRWCLMMVVCITYMLSWVASCMVGVGWGGTIWSKHLDSNLSYQARTLFFYFLSKYIHISFLFPSDNFLEGIVMMQWLGKLPNWINFWRLSNSSLSLSLFCWLKINFRGSLSKSQYWDMQIKNVFAFTLPNIPSPMLGLGRMFLHY